VSCCSFCFVDDPESLHCLLADTHTALCAFSASMNYTTSLYMLTDVFNEKISNIAYATMTLADRCSILNSQCSVEECACKISVLQMNVGDRLVISNESTMNTRVSDAQPVCGTMSFIVGVCSVAQGCIDE
jgi:hypothetical protein